MALGGRNGTAVLNIAEDTEGSSLLAVEPREVRNSPGSRFVDVEQTELRTLDSVLPQVTSDARPLYLKLDTQGSELEILRGAGRTLQRARLVESELSLVSLYRGGPLFDDVVSFLRDRGFALISVEGVDEERDTGHMLQVDAILHRVAR
jgi:hypothetical protein